MLIVDISQSRGTSFEIGYLSAKSFLKTPKGQRFKKRPDRPPLAGTFNFIDAQRAFERFAPNLWQEFLGMAEGFELPLERVVRELGNFTVPYPRTGCSAVITNGVYGRNYDFQARYYEPRFAAVQPDRTYASFGFTQFLIGRADGMNEKGLVCGLHLVSFSRPGPGFLASLIVRMVLDQCATTEEAINLLQRVPHGLKYNYSILDASNNGAIVEASPKNIGVLKGQNLVCTNHFQSPLMQPINPKMINHSKKRLPPLSRMAVNASAEVVLGNGALEFYRQLNNSFSPAFHHGYVKGAGTLHTITCIPASGDFLVGVGGDSEPTILNINDWRNGEDIDLLILSGQLGGRKSPFSKPMRV